MLSEPFTHPLTAAPGPYDSPVAVGGVGGSGTRAVAEILRMAGVFLGDDLNAANDNLSFTLLFKHRSILSCDDGEFSQLVDLFADALRGGDGLSDAQRALVARCAAAARPDDDPDWLRARSDHLASRARAHASPGQRWGWKEPNTHIVLDRLRRALPGLRYVHVVRNGLDVALRKNRQQMRLWGPYVLGVDAIADTPRSALAYWCAAQRRAFALGSSMGSRFHVVRFDRLCTEPEREVSALLAFAGIGASTELLAKACAFIVPPAPKARSDGDGFAAADVEYVRSLGFA